MSQPIDQAQKKMKKLLPLALITSCLPLLALAFEQPPALKVTTLNLVEVGDTYVQIVLATNREADDNEEITITYRRKSPEAKARSISELNAYYNYTGITQEKNYLSISSIYPDAGLLPDTEYVIRVKTYEDDNVTSSKKLTFRTALASPMSITSLSATTVSGGDTLTIYGQGFGKQTGRVKLGYYGYDNAAEVLSWSKNEITVQLPEVMTDGPVEVEAFRTPAMRATHYSQSVFSENVDVLNESHIYGVEGVCDRPGVIADTYEAIINFNDLYLEGFGRPLNCEELVFHLQHSTPHDRLRSWLAEQDVGVWWTNLKIDYDQQTFYDDNYVYLMSNGTLYKVGSLMAAAAWGIIPDDAKYIPELFDESDPLYYSYIGVLDNAIDLTFQDGSYHTKVMKMIKGEDVTFNDQTLDDYYTANIDLLTTSVDDDDSFTEEVCDYLACGMVY